MKLLIKNGQVVDPAVGEVINADLLIEGDRIASLQPRIVKGSGCQVINAAGCYIFPGFIDLHSHLREPGQEWKETIATGTAAAAAGGYTALACMGNTEPPADNEGVISLIKAKAVTAPVPVYPIGCATRGRQGLLLAEIGDLVEAGAVAVSDDGSPIMKSDVMRRVLEYSRIFDLPVISHCEDKNLAGHGVMHEGYYSTLLGLEGIPAAAEEVQVYRDLNLANLTGARLHIAHVSTAGAVQLIREAKQQGVRVTAEVTPHHLALTDRAVCSFDTNTKVNPPLRTPDDIAALKEGLRDGTIDAIATDHAPHAFHEKDVEYNYAPFGISGLETAVPLVWEVLVRRGVLTPLQLAEKMAVNPARILGLPERKVQVGAEANLTLINPELKRRVSPDEFLSLGKNTPFAGWELTGWPVLTIAGGRVVMSRL